MSNKFCVYSHIRLDTNTIFYIGKGLPKRANDKWGRNNYWKNIVNKHGYKVKIIERNLTEKEAFDLEIKLIKKYGRIDNNTGILVNLTDGGEGASGTIISKETKEKLRIKSTGRRHKQKAKDKVSKARRGKKLTECHKKKLSKSHKGKKLSKETKIKMSNYRKGRPSKRKRAVVNCRGQKFDSLTQAGIAFKRCPGDIGKACSGKQKTSGKYKDGSPVKWGYDV